MKRSRASSPLDLVDLVALVFEGQAHRGTDPFVVLDQQDAAHSIPIILDEASDPRRPDDPACSEPSGRRPAACRAP